MAGKFAFAAALFALAIPGAAKAALTGVQVEGVLHDPLGGNGFDPATGRVPAGYGNSAGLPVTIGSGIEFGYQNLYEFVTVDFTDTQLIITETQSFGFSGGWSMEFTSLTSGAFEQLTLVNSSIYPDLTYSLSGDTITITYRGFDVARGFDASSATFNIAAAGAVPEPATWAMMLIGFAAIGVATRRRRRALLLA